MPLDVSAVQGALQAQGLDGWLWYDFQGANPIACRLAGLQHGEHMASRRWFYLIPRTGQPRGLVHAIEPHTLDRLPGDKTPYAGRSQLESGLRELLSGVARVAMEYSPHGAIPYVSRVDAGTIELVRASGAEVTSSGDLVQQFEAAWDENALATHRAAAESLYRIKDRAFATVAQRLRDGVPTREWDIRALMWQWFSDEGLTSDAAPLVAAQENASDPHYMPTAEGSRTIGHDELLLLDLWGKQPTAGAVFADISWVGFTGAEVPPAMSRVFAVAAAARDAAIDLVQQRAAAGQEVRGFEVDRAARQVIDEAGFGRYVLHRTGHSLGETVHGNGAHLDDYETHDERRLLPGSGFTVEPGLYLGSFGLRTEVNVVWTSNGVEVTGPRQSEIVKLI